MRPPPPPLYSTPASPPHPSPYTPYYTPIHPSAPLSLHTLLQPEHPFVKIGFECVVCTVLIVGFEHGLFLGLCAQSRTTLQLVDEANAYEIFMPSEP